MSNASPESKIQCPSCNVSLDVKDVASHCDVEIDRLRRMHENSTLNKMSVGEFSETIGKKKPYNIFQQVQKNRQTRLKQRSRKRVATQTPEVLCPICNKNFTTIYIQRHVEKCLRGISYGADEQSSNDEYDAEDRGDEEYEEYEWAGQKRIRASSLLEGGYAGIGLGQTTSNRNGENDEDEDLNVDEDDTEIYGPTQYDEADVISITNFEKTISNENDIDDENVTGYMRSLITSSKTGNVSLEQTRTTCLDDDYSLKNEIDLNCHPCSSTAFLNSSSTLSQHIIDSLKMKLRQYENHVANKYKCLICLDEYRKPAISVACWHVHCEECWLRSLGTRKLCPQCNLITSPKDLRRIYL